MDAEDLAVLGVGDDFDEAFVRVEDGGLGVASEWELANFYFMAFLLGDGFTHADGADLWFGVGCAGDAIARDRFGVFACDVRGGDCSTHGAGVCKLGQASDDVSDGEDAGFVCLHPLIRVDEAALDFDLCLVDAYVVGARCAADGDEDLFSFLYFRLAVALGEGDLYAGLRLFNLFDLRGDMHVDTALLVLAQELLADVGIFCRDDAVEHLDDGDFCVEALHDGSELHTNGAGADADERLGEILHAENLDVGEDLVAGFVAGNHARVGTGGEHDLLRFDLLLLAFVVDVDGMHAVFGGAGEASVAGDDGDLVFLHQVVEAAHMLVDDALLAREYLCPVDGGFVEAVDAVLGAVLGVVEDLCGKQQGFGGHAAYVEAGAAELVACFNERSLEAVLRGADGA